MRSAGWWGTATATNRMRDARLTGVILAAGRGERLRPLTDTVPKALIPVVGRPLLMRILEALREASVERVVVGTGWLADRVIHYVRDELGSDVMNVQAVPVPDYVVGPLMTFVRAVSTVIDADSGLEENDGSDDEEAALIVFPGDCLLPPSVAQVLVNEVDRLSEECPVIVAVAESGTGAEVYGTDDGVLTGLGRAVRPEGTLVGRSAMGIAVSRRSVGVFSAALDSGLTRLADVINMMITRDTSPRFVQVENEFPVVDIDTPSSLLMAVREVLSRPDLVPIQDGVFVPGGDVIDVGHDLVLSMQTSIDAGTGLHGPVYIGQGCNIEGGSRIGPWACIEGGSVIGRNCTMHDALVLSGSSVPDGALLSNTIVFGDIVLRSDE